MRRENKIVPRLAVYLALTQDRKTLFIRRANTGYADGKLSLVAGHVEDGEGLKAAMIREASEEVGIEIPPDALTFEHFQYRNSADFMLMFFSAPETGPARWLTKSLTNAVSLYGVIQTFFPPTALNMSSWYFRKFALVRNHISPNLMRT